MLKSLHNNPTDEAQRNILFPGSNLNESWFKCSSLRWSKKAKSQNLQLIKVPENLGSEPVHLA